MSQKVLPADLTDEELEKRARVGILNSPQTADLFQREMHHRETKAALNNVGAQLYSAANLLGQISKSLAEHLEEMQKVSKSLDKIGVTLGQMNTAKTLGLTDQAVSSAYVRRLPIIADTHAPIWSRASRPRRLWRATTSATCRCTCLDVVWCHVS